MLNRWVLSRDRKTATEGADVTWSGRLFQTRAAAIGKARSPTVNSRVQLTISDEDELAQSLERAWKNIYDSDKFDIFDIFGGTYLLSHSQVLNTRLPVYICPCFKAKTIVKFFLLCIRGPLATPMVANLLYCFNPQYLKSTIWSFTCDSFFHTCPKSFPLYHVFLAAFNAVMCIQTHKKFT